MTQTLITDYFPLLNNGSRKSLENNIELFESFIIYICCIVLFCVRIIPEIIPYAYRLLDSISENWQS